MWRSSLRVMADHRRTEKLISAAPHERVRAPSRMGGFLGDHLVEVVVKQRHQPARVGPTRPSPTGRPSIAVNGIT